MMSMLICPDEDVLELMSGRASDREEDESACEHACSCPVRPDALVVVEVPPNVLDADDIAF